MILSNRLEVAMIIKYKNTFFKVDMSNTKNNIGISDDDTWCLVNLIATNNEFHYEVSRESLTYSEVKKALDYIKDYYYNNIITHKKLTFIKNYFILICHDIKDNKKVLELKLISLLNKSEKNYSLFFEDDEIKKFITMTENFTIFK